MPREKRPEDESSLQQPGPEGYRFRELLPEQVELLRIIRGFPGGIHRIAFSPDGNNFASASADQVAIFDTVTWSIERTIHEKHVSGTSGPDFSWAPDSSRMAVAYSEGVEVLDCESGRPLWRRHLAPAIGVAWSPTGDLIAVSHGDGSVSVLEAETGESHYEFTAGPRRAEELTWSHHGKFLASEASSNDSDSEIVIWNSEIGSVTTRLVGHDSAITDLAWSPHSLTLASVSSDSSTRIWDPESGILTHTIEVHTDGIWGVSFSPDGRVLVTSSSDGTMRFLRADDLAEVGTVHFREDDAGLASGRERVAFAPGGRTLCAARGDQILVFRVDLDALAGLESGRDLVHYTTAKLVLVGDSGVGKTGLGWRLSHPEFREHSSTHGQQFWMAEDLGITRQDGTECEAVLWDLAGQHVYRPAHVIFLEKVDTALMVFDPTNRQESLKGVEFWLDQLAGKGELPPTILVGGRMDRGASVLSAEELEQFCQQRGIAGGYIGTSARTSEGIEPLTEVLKRLIPWDSKPATVTTATFKRIKDYVLGIKEDPDRNLVLVSADELREELVATDPGWSFGPDEMMTAVGHLENHGYVAILTSSAGQQYILLLPTLLPDLASSIILQADKNPKGLGALSETDLLRGDYQFPEFAGLGQAEREVLLDAMVVRLLRHNVCFRETLGAETLLIFPGLIKQKRPLQDEVETFDDVSYLVRGRVENAYPAIAVLLGYTQAFTRVSQWQNQAQYEFARGQVCGFRMQQDREGEIELVLYYSEATPTYGRSLFQGLFEKFLFERDVEVTRFAPVMCPVGHRQERATVVQRRREGKGFVFCGECGQKVMLAGTADPPVLGTSVSRQVRREESLALLRSAYEANLARIKAYRRDRAAPRCHLSPVGDKAAWTRKLARDLRDAGVYLVEHGADLPDDDLLVLVGMPQVVERRAVLLLTEDGGPAAGISGSFGSIILDFRDETRYALALFDLVLTLHAIPLDHDAFSPLREAMETQWRQVARDRDQPAAALAASQPEREVFISYAWNEESKAVAAELDRAFQDEGILIVQDQRDLGFRGDIRGFMEGIGRGRCVIVILSDKYLESENCLFELLEIAMQGDFADRVFPVVLDSARIYKPLDRLRYVRYWEQQIAEFDEELKSVSAANLQGFRDEIDLYTQIRAELPRLADILKNMNALTPEAHRESGYAQVVQAVLRRLAR